MIDLNALIEGENYGHTEGSLMSPGYGGGGTNYPALVPIGDVIGETGGSIRTQPADAAYGYADGVMDIEQMLDKPADGWTGPSLDAFTGVSYAGSPGYGIQNDQLGQSSRTSLGGFTIPSEEVGVGRAPGWQWAHYPHVEQHNIRRESYVDQGVFADGQPYFPDDPDGQLVQNHRPVMRPFWDIALENPGFDPAQRYLAAGSGIIEQAPSFALSQILGALGAVGWGVS